MTRTKEDAHKQILAFRHDLLSGKAAFADLASRESHCSSARRGGEPLLHAMMPLNLLGSHRVCCTQQPFYRTMSRSHLLPQSVCERLICLFGILNA